MTSTDRVRYLTTVVGSFHGRVVAARLGAEGILVHLKGVDDGLYPVQGAVEVYVNAAQLDLAREILLGDAVDDAFDSISDTEGGIANLNTQDDLAGVGAAEGAGSGEVDDDDSAGDSEAIDDLTPAYVVAGSVSSHSQRFGSLRAAVAVSLVAVMLIVWVVAATR
jgi:hypothetical protein